jgi:hypothetical protein
VKIDWGVAAHDRCNANTNGRALDHQAAAVYGQRNSSYRPGRLTAQEQDPGRDFFRFHEPARGYIRNEIVPCGLLE